MAVTRDQPCELSQLLLKPRQALLLLGFLLLLPLPRLSYPLLHPHVLPPPPLLLLQLVLLLLLVWLLVRCTCICHIKSLRRVEVHSSLPAGTASMQGSPRVHLKLA
jgi:hypothetical protein